MKNLILIRPSDEYAGEVMDFRAEMLQSGGPFDGCAGLEDVNSYAEWADFEPRLRARYGDGYVPSEVYLAVRLSDRRLAGILDFRLRLSPYLLQYGGNIGYSVRPSERRKGYGTEMLRLALPICRARGEKKILIVCDRENEASRRIICKNGGVLENTVADLGGGFIQRYWITL